MIDIYSYEMLQETYGEQVTQHKLTQIGIVIEKFCNYNPSKFKASRCIDVMIVEDEDLESKHESFSMLLYLSC